MTTQSEIYSSPEQEIAPELPPENAAPHRFVTTLADLLQHKKQIFLTTLSCLAIAVLLYFVLPSKYEGIAQIMTPTQVPSMESLVASGGLGSLGSLAGGGLGLKDANLAFIGMLQSRTVEDAMIAQFHLLDLYKAKDMTAARLKLDKRTDIKEEKSTLISITVTDNNPQRAAAMANAYVDHLRTLTRDMSAKENARQRAYFEDQLKSQRDSLIKAEVELAKVQQNKGIVQPEGQAAALLETMATLRAEIAAQQVEVDALRSYSTEKNPDYQIAQKRLETMKQEASKMSTHGSSTDFGDLGLKDVPNAGIDYIRAYREVQYQTALYSVLLKEYEAARLDEANDAYTIQVVDQAVTPDWHSFPKLKIFLVVAFLFGLAVSYGWIWFQKRWREWMKSEEFVVSLTKLKSALRFR